MEVFRDKFLDVIQGLDLDGPMWGDVCQLGDLLNELQNSTSPRSGPYPGFFESIFPSYVVALTDIEKRTNYYLSTVELLALCKSAKQNVITVRRINNNLEYERHYIADPEALVVITSIIGNNVGAVRSHFERVMSVADVCRQRELLEEAIAESKRETEELRRMEAEDSNINVSGRQTNEKQASVAEERNEDTSSMEAAKVVEDSAKRRKVDLESMMKVDTEQEEFDNIRSSTTDQNGKKKANDSSWQKSEEEEREMERPEPFYKVEAIDLKKSPDPRAKRELDFQTLVTRIRDYPTIPADPENNSEAWLAALADDMAIELPTVHCSFRGCSWCGQTGIS